MPLNDRSQAESPKKMPQINADFNLFSVVESGSMEWVQSPAVGVWRKRVYLDGPVEAAKVTSLVRYDAGARFPEHGHPGGEEILVLEGKFSDHKGHFGEGWHLLNPSDSRHESYSDDGCHLLVKLRQYSDKDTIYQDTERLDWKRGKTNGVSIKLLYENADRGITTSIVRLEKGTTIPFQNFSGGKEIFVIDGNFEDEVGVHGGGSWLRYPPDGGNSMTTQSGCKLYVQTGGLEMTR